METNMFANALLPTDAIQLRNLKLNKYFVEGLIKNLEAFYHIRKEVKDDVRSTTIWLYPNNSRVCNSRFIASAKQILFKTRILVYGVVEPNTNMTPDWCYGALYEKYKDVEGTSAEKEFLNHNHGKVTFVIPIIFDQFDKPSNDTLRDIMRLLEKDGYKRNL